jgi:hypothetical protein
MKVSLRLRCQALALLSLFVVSAQAQTITNPSFETDTFTVFPGYVSGNAPITGWSVGDPARAGINPGGGSPFADNGTIPAGSQVAFLQNSANSSLITVINGLTIGVTYKVSFRVNARNGNTANLKVDIDANNIMNTAVTSVGGANAYKYFAFDFTASDVAQTLKLRNDAGGDNTLLVDDFSIAQSHSGWSYAAWNDDASAGVDGTKTYTHAFRFGSSAGTTINGIPFVGVAGSNPGGATFSTTGLGSVFNNDGNNVSGGSRAMANDFVYNGFPATITINGLIPGAEYVATIYSVGWEDDGTRGATFSVGNDRLTVSQDQFGNNNGIRFIYRYIATGSSVTLTYAPLSGNSIHTYGFSNYQLAAPPTAPSIVTDPKSRFVSEGQPFTLASSASGFPLPTYHWQKNGQDVPGATTSTLTIGAATPNDAGGYTLIADNTGGSATSAVAVVKVGFGLVNPSFEDDNFTVPPGYVSGNGPITGWASLGNHGINPGGGSPFADNGAIPDRTHVAFMQGDGAMSQMVSGFTPGLQYYVVYSENARSGGVPALAVKMGDSLIVPQHSRAPVGGGNPYVEVSSDPFIADSDTLQLSFIKSNPNGGDTTILIDNVCVLALPEGTSPSVLRAPQSQIVSVGQTATFSAGGFGSLPLEYQWQKNGVNIPGATGTTLSFNNISKSADAGYTVVIHNDSGSVTSAVARLTVWEPIPGLFNTGLDTNVVALADNLADPHYRLTTNPDGGSPDAIVEDSTAFPIVGGPWLGNTASSKWIGPKLNTGASPIGIYTYRMTFNLTNRDPNTVVIQGQWATDNSGRQILVNGVATGNPQSTVFSTYTSFNISTSNAAFLPGDNTIDFVVENEATAGYTGVRIEFVASNARILPNIPPSITLQPVSQTLVVESNSITFNVLATGSDPLAYQWRKNGTPILGATNVSFTIASATTNDNAAYTVRVVNGSGQAISDPAQLAVVYRRVPGIFSTGVNDDLTLAPDSSTDLHWIIGSSVDPVRTGPDAIVVDSANSPVPPWISVGPKSKWIAPQSNQNTGNAQGNYTYQTFFDLTGVDLCTFRLAGQLAVDNSVVDILVNGVSQGVNGGAFASWLPFNLTTGFVSGLNSVDFIVNNAPATPNATGLRVDLDGLVRIGGVLPARLAITRTAPDTLTVTWTPTSQCDKLQATTDVTGGWTTIRTTSPAVIYTTNAPALFLRVTQ